MTPRGRFADTLRRVLHTLGRQCHSGVYASDTTARSRNLGGRAR